MRAGPWTKTVDILVYRFIGCSTVVLVFGNRNSWKKGEDVRVFFGGSLRNTRGKKQSSEAWSRARFIGNEARGSALVQRRHRGTANQAPSKRDRTWVQKRPGARRSPTRGPWSGTRGRWWLGGLLLYTREMVRRRGPCATLRNTPCWPSSFYMFPRGSGRRCRRKRWLGSMSGRVQQGQKQLGSVGRV